MLFNIFIDNLDDETEYILSKFKGDTKLGRVADMLNTRSSTQRDLEKFENWIKKTHPPDQHGESQRSAPRMV